MRFKRTCLQALHQHSLRAGLNAHPVLFAHHVPLLIKLTENRIVEALRFQQEPEFQAIAGEVVKVFSGVLARAGVQTRAAVFLDDLCVSIGNNVAVGFLDCGIELFFENRKLGGIGFLSLVALAIVAVVHALHFLQRLLFSRPVLGSDGLGPLERHVLEHMSDAGFPARIVHRSGVDVGVKRDHRRLVPLENNEVQSVRERKFGDALLEILKRLGAKEQWAKG